MRGIELIRVGDVVLAYLVRATTEPAETTFITADTDGLQAGFVVYPSEGQVQPHTHLPVERHLVGTSEFIQVRSGRCVVEVYSDDRELVATRALGPGDAILTLAGGHGFRMLEDTVLFELKQGPFLPGQDKERFEPSLARTT